ncbi:UDP-glycosyltransferase 73C1-like protein [Cinnamomum micranthum f. kanehirae]|uniref:Glycosyltransferase n=1 Tax=Cinnamomum micranthum f. kanehirae TaxID=337451 RepID=A0A443P2J8_9MAGN|nr:UDP-glycosyltransferase 73C1-like protein [Cinnamomum micranthum f. kanehirae]
MASQEVQQPHFIFIPFLAQGHMIPMMDMARLFAKRGVISTILTTSLNAARFKPVIDPAAESGLPIRLIQLDFPWQEAGLPQGVENVDEIDSMNQGRLFIPALQLLQEQIERFLKEDHQPVPSCMISDFCLPWTYDIACKLNIPRIAFHGMCSFSLLCRLNLRRYKPHEGVGSEFELFVLPGLPDKIEIFKAHLQDDVINKGNSEVTEMFDRFAEVDLKSYGVVINSFNELELEYVDYYKKATGIKVWTIGPVSLCNKERSDKAQRGNKAVIDAKTCLNWLDSKKSKSVLYSCFGSISRLTPAQLREIALGLEASDQPFVLVIRKCERIAEVEKWLSAGFEERVKERGLIVRGWAPQTLILSHPSVGGFLTHCGWNSTMEGICAGLPLITWPQFGEQFLNEKLIVNVLKIGVSIGVEAALKWFEEEKNVLVKMEVVKKAVERLMGSDNEAEERRMRARELAESARKTMEEGGSSYNNMTLLIEDIMEQTRQKME